MSGRIYMNLRLVMAGAAVALGAVATSLRGTPLPESYPLGEANERGAVVDEHLAAWLAEHVERPSPLDMDAEAFAAYVVKQDPITTVYLRLTRAIRDNAPEVTLRPMVDQAMKLVTEASANGRTGRYVEETLSHPLLPFLLRELLHAGVLKGEERQRVQGTFAQTGLGTCASKQKLLDEIAKERLQEASDDELRELLARVDSFRSQGFKKAAMRRFLTDLPEPRRRVVADQALSMAKSVPGLIRGDGSVAWLVKMAEEAKADGEDEKESAVLAFNQARRLAARHQCAAARDLLRGALPSLKNDLKTLDDAVNTGKAIDGCFRVRDTKLRAEFWRQIAGLMGDTYGIFGWAEAKLRLGFIGWSANDFPEAKALFKEVQAKAKANGAKMRKYEARATFGLGRIAENESSPDQALPYYRDYLLRFPDQENFEEALMGLVLIHADRGEWEPALKPIESLIQAQTQLTPDERSGSALSFALFWAGRGYLQQGRRTEAAEMWRRVATEYYSTYYGALGHYLLERLTGRRLALQPSRAPVFRMAALRDAFAAVDQRRVRRAEALMRLGLRSEAACEIEELDLADGKPEKLLVKALMMHAAGQWLDAVKAYDALPRSFRSALAPGLERIIFPIRYHTEVKTLAERAGVDPDLVMAIIRQESVFNPLARSPVGAMGLMQLMPDTASMEFRRLTPGYLGDDEKRHIRERLANPLNLLVAETNLALGVHHLRSLLGKYGVPVYVLSAYNASPAAVQRWITNIASKDILAFIEKIPYKETRGYVKLVLRNYFYYKRWYGEPGSNLTHFDVLTASLAPLLKPEAQVATAPAKAAVAPATKSAGPAVPAVAPVAPVAPLKDSEESSVE